jgi:flagellar basal body-associated protein FliL
MMMMMMMVLVVVVVMAVVMMMMMIMASTPESCSLLKGRASVRRRGHDPEERTLRTSREEWG